MNPFGTRSAAEQFQRDVARLFAGPDQAVSTGPAAASSASPAGPVALAARLRAAGEALAPVPRPEFRAALRTRLVAVAGVQAATGGAAALPARPAAHPIAAPLAQVVTWAQGRRGQRGLALAAGTMASVIAVTGVAVASSSSLPGDPFYGVKREAESLQLHFASGDVAKGTRHLEFAATRLREVKGLTLGRSAIALGAWNQMPLAAGLSFGGSVEERVRSTLRAMDEETTVGNALLTTAYRTSHSANPLRILAAFASRQSDGLQAILPDLPPAARPRAKSSLSLVTSLGQQAGILLSLGACTQACNPQTAAPVLPTNPTAGPSPKPTTTGEPPCTCPVNPDQPTAAPTYGPTAEPSASPSATDSGSPSPSPSATPRPSHSPTPRPSWSGLPVPVPTTPVPLPTLPVPLPTSPTPLPLPLPTVVASPLVR